MASLRHTRKLRRHTCTKRMLSIGGRKSFALMVTASPTSKPKRTRRGGRHLIPRLLPGAEKELKCRSATNGRPIFHLPLHPLGGEGRGEGGVLRGASWS